MTGHPPHHLHNIKSKGGDLTPQAQNLRAYQLSYDGYGISDIAVKEIGRDDESARDEVRRRIKAGQAFSSRSVG